ncbi:hypothetical protein D3C72_2246290 [compost metagenome]
MDQQATDGKRQHREEPALPAPLISQEAESRPLVVDMDQIEEGGDLHPRVAKWQQLDHGELARLVQYKGQHCQPQPTQAAFMVSHVHQAN